MTQILVLFHSIYGHIERMAQAEAEGAAEVDGVSAVLKRVPETLSDEALRQMGGKTGSTVPVATPGELADYDAIIFGTPTRFGNMSGQMRSFLDQTGGLWMSGALIGKVGSVFTSSATQHGGQESTILTFHPTLLHQGMVIVGLPYSEARQMGIDEIKGGSPYGASTIAGGQGERQPSAQELGMARSQGRHVATIAAKLARHQGCVRAMPKHFSSVPIPSRRSLLMAGVGLAATAGLPGLSSVADAASAPANHPSGQRTMSTFTTHDSTEIFYKDWGQGRPVVFSHGWPLSADAWEDQMVFLAEHGYRVIAHDRRGHGRSGQPWAGNDMDTYADDLATLFETLKLKDAVMVGHSTGGGEVARYIGRHGNTRVGKAVLVGAVPPLMLKTAANPNGVPKEAFDGIRAGVTADRSQFFKDLSFPFYGANRPGAKVSQGVRDAFWLMGMQGSLKSELDCIKQFSETDFTEDLKKISVPTLFVHGDDDQIVPIATTSTLAAKLVKHSTLKVYAGAPHGLATTHKDQLNADLLAFIQG